MSISGSGGLKYGPGFQDVDRNGRAEDGAAELAVCFFTYNTIREADLPTKSAHLVGLVSTFGEAET
jgi:hypothetical protein